MDDADLLDAGQEKTLTAKCRSLQMSTGRQLAVVTLRALGGHDVADYGRKLGNYWGVGRKGLNDGVLLIVAPQERAVRIEVGKGLERVLTNSEAKAIIDDAMMPRLRSGNVPGALMAGTDGIVRELEIPERKTA